MTAEPFAVNTAMLYRVLVGAGWAVETADGFGPSGLTLTVTAGGRRGSVVVTQADRDDGEEWLHASVAWADSVPTYEDLTTLHRAVFGRRRWAYQVFAPETEHVNIHEHALHLFGRADGAPALPDFTHGTGSI